MDLTVPHGLGGLRKLGIITEGYITYSRGSGRENECQQEIGQTLIKSAALMRTHSVS